MRSPRCRTMIVSSLLKRLMRLKRDWPTILGVWQIVGAAFGDSRLTAAVQNVDDLAFSARESSGIGFIGHDGSRYC